MPLFLLFIALPVLELVVMIQVGAKIGAWSVIGLLFLSAFAGVTLIRWQGFFTLAKARSQLAQGQLPAKAIGHGLLLTLAGVLLIIPGFISDLVGLLLLLPPVRWLLAAMMARKLAAGANFRFSANGTAPETPSMNPVNSRQGTILEGEYRREDETP